MKPRLNAKTVNHTPRMPHVHFELTHPNARAVCLAGSFNDWHAAATPMVALGEGRWAKELTLAPGRYEYRFVVDGEWLADPGAAEVAENGFGGLNSVLVVSAQAPQASSSPA